MKKVLVFIWSMLFLINDTQAQLVFKEADINTGPSNCTPWIVGNLNGKMVLSGVYPAIGRELLLSDGTLAGTTLVKDIAAGAIGSGAFGKGSAILNGKLFFGADVAASGAELWISDGTAAGTQLIKDINPGANDAFPSYGYITAFNGKVYFAATDGVKGKELWVTDGTAAGTQMVKDINPGANNSSPYSLTVLNGKLYFSADDGTNGTELWVTDGTSPGTQMVKDINTGINASYPTALSLEGYVQFNNKIYFIANTTAEGSELWSSDGTAAGTQLVKDINPGASDGMGTNFFSMAISNGKLFFRATNGTDGDELWATDGTTAGTQMAKDINPGNSGSFVRYLTKWGNKVVFTATDGTNGEEPWISDGTAAGTTLLKDIFPGATTSKANYYFSYKNYFYFTAQQINNDVQLWQSDGTAAGTKIVGPPLAPNANPVGNISASKFYLNPADTTIYFSGNYNADGEELWSMKDTSTAPPTGISTSHLHLENFGIYPNPNTGTFTVEVNNDFKNGSVSVYDMMGKEISKFQIPNSKFQITLNQPSGIYIVKLQLDDAVLAKRVIVE